MKKKIIPLFCVSVKSLLYFIKSLLLVYNLFCVRMCVQALNGLFYIIPSEKDK